MSNPFLVIESVESGRVVVSLTHTKGQPNAYPVRARWLEDKPRDTVSYEWKCEPPECAEFDGHFTWRKDMKINAEGRVWVEATCTHGFKLQSEPLRVGYVVPRDSLAET